MNYLVFFGLIFEKKSKPCRIDIPVGAFYYRHPLDAAITDIKYIIYVVDVIINLMIRVNKPVNLSDTSELFFRKKCIFGYVLRIIF